MIVPVAVLIGVLLLVALPTVLFLKNITLFAPPPKSADAIARAAGIPISVCIPARDEAGSIRESLTSILQSRHHEYEVLVLDDHSGDETAELVREIARTHQNVQLLTSKPLPTGWNGKQHACWQLALAARYERILFLDADVRLSADALERCIAFQESSGAHLVSGFPFQKTGTLLEKMLIPMMHYVLLGYLPIDRMRSSLQPEFAAGCGQMFLADKSAYLKCDGHRAIAASRHDGIQLPRAFRRGGFATDIFDATEIASCRMYHNASQVVRGLLKNATEGIANAKLILPFTILLVGGSVAPWILLAVSLFSDWNPGFQIAYSALSIVSLSPRLAAVFRFRQSVFGALLHPLGVSFFVVLQWVAFLQKGLGYQVRWRGRS